MIFRQIFDMGSYNFIINRNSTPEMQSFHQNNPQLLQTRLQQFKALYSSEQSKFATSLETLYFIVSAKYIKQWIQFCTVEAEHRPEPSPLNHDLMDAGGQLRKNLVEGQDFEIFTERLYNVIKLNKGFELRRDAVFVGNQKKVPIYLEILKYLKMSNKDVYDIDMKILLAADVKIKQLEFSHLDTVKNFIRKVREMEKVPPSYKGRAWRNSTTQNKAEDVYKYISDKSSKYTVYRFEGIGKLIEKDSITIGDVNLQQDQYFIIEFTDEHSNFFFSISGEQKCEGCYKYHILPFTCGCKTVSYCSQECQEKDLRYHIKDCKYAEQREMNEDIAMNITPNSALGKVGLSNLGNTCFMNSCLQCLSNTAPLTDYFLKKYFDKEINKDNPLGSKGKLARNYAKFIKSMWCQSNTTFSPHNLKGAVAKINPIFSGYAQHDSQEFFSFIADGIHEDLNRVLTKPYVESVESKDRPDEVVAKESWKAYIQRNQSIIVDLLTGQYKSKVICPDCKLESITFDPFTTVSLPIPEEPTVSELKYYVIFNNNEKQALRISLQYIKPNTKQWIETATKKLNASEEDYAFYVLTVFENIYPFHSTSTAEIIQKTEIEGKFVFLLELSEEEKKITDRIELTTLFSKKSYYGDYDNLWFKRPFFYDKSTATGLTIYERMLRYLQHSAEDRSHIQNYEQYLKKMMDLKPFTLVLKWGKSLQRYYGKVEVKFDHQLPIQDLQIRLEEILKDKNIKDCELEVRFTKETAKHFDFDRLKKCNEFDDKSNKKIIYKDSRKAMVSLDDCFKFFEQKENLEHGNEWYCPRCKDHKLATKQMTIYKAPEILILHLKRFKNKGAYRKQKNEASVKFPLILDMSSYVIDPLPMSSYIEEMKQQGKYIEPSYTACYNIKSKPEYELYAISNHYGGMGGGHYTAYGKNKGKWLEFNDSSVHFVKEEELRGSGAYMLFYRRIDSMQIK